MRYHTLNKYSMKRGSRIMVTSPGNQGRYTTEKGLKSFGSIQKIQHACILRYNYVSQDSGVQILRGRQVARSRVRILTPIFPLSLSLILLLFRLAGETFTNDTLRRTLRCFSLFNRREREEREGLRPPQALTFLPPPQPP